MKIIFRVFLVILIVLIILLAFGIYMTRVARLDESEEMNVNWALWMFMGSAFLALFSLRFNILKLADNPRRKKIYKLIRVGDLIFSLYLFVFSVMVLGRIMINYINLIDTNYQMIIPMGTIVMYAFFILLSIALFVDNLKFHKSLSHSNQEDSIEDIGK